MEVRLTVTGEDATAAMQSLAAWLAGDDKLRGRVRPVVVAPQPGTMGSAVEVLMVAVEHGGLATAVASVLISWIRRQSGKVSVSAARPDGTKITVTVGQVRAATTEDVGVLVTEIAATLDGTGAGK